MTVTIEDKPDLLDAVSKEEIQRSEAGHIAGLLVSGEVNNGQETESGIEQYRAPAEKVVTFEDERGISRRPNELAPECYASSEIQKSVSEHFINVDSTIEEIERELTEITEGQKNDDQQKPFNPLTDSMRKQLLSMAEAQIPALSTTTVKDETKVVQSGRFIKRKKEVTEAVTHTERKEGYTASLDDEDTQQEWRMLLGRVTSSETESEAMAQNTKVQEQLLELLTGTKSTHYEIGHRPTSMKKLPLLATKLRDSGLVNEQIASLSWGDIAKMVPEVAAVFGEINDTTEIVDAKIEHQQLVSLNNHLRLISPKTCDTIARIYYDNALLARLDAVQKQIKQLDSAPLRKLYPDEPLDSEDHYIRDQQESITSFFDGALPADTLFVHGTPYGPRVIAAGQLRPPHGMSLEEFSFNTDRTIDPTAKSVVGIDGSRAVHWAGASNGRDYGQNDSHDLTLLKEEEKQKQHYPLGGEQVAREMARGGFGQAQFAIRLADLVKTTPYVGLDLSYYIGPQSKGNREQARYGTVELTPVGWQQVESKLGNTAAEGYDDVSYFSAHTHHELDELFDHSYPIEDMIIGIPSKDQDTIITALRDHGWSEQQIASQTYIYSRKEDTQDLQSRVLLSPKYPRSVTVAIRTDT